MGMQLIITSSSSGSSAPLSLDVSEYHLELSGLSEGRKLTVAEDGGRIAVSIAAVEDAPVQEQARQEVEQPVAQAVERAAVPGQVAPVGQAAMREAVSGSVQAAVPAAQPDAVAEPEQLYQRLAALRKQIASEVKLPPYIIFHDATLREMSRVLPADMEALKGIQGVGQAKLEKYGMRFLQAIREYSAGRAA